MSDHKSIDTNYMYQKDLEFDEDHGSSFTVNKKAQRLKWSGTVRVGNGHIGWITLPFNFREKILIGSYYNIWIYLDGQKALELTLKLVKHHSSTGFFIPQKVCLENALISKNVLVECVYSDSIPVKILSNKIVYPPVFLLEKYNIHENDIYEFQIIVKGQSYNEYVRFFKNERSHEGRYDDYYITIHNYDIPAASEAHINLIRKIEILVPTNDRNLTQTSIYLPDLFPDAIIGKINTSQAIIFFGKYQPLITPIYFPLTDIVHYFGCYHADGTVAGSQWEIIASTCEQAAYYVPIFKSIINNTTSLDFRLVYSKLTTDTRSDNEIIDFLVDYWTKAEGVVLTQKNIKIRLSKRGSILKTSMNKYGALRIRHFKTLSLELHCRLLEMIKNTLYTFKDKTMIWKFLLGVLEGDGFINGSDNAFSIGFSCHNEDDTVQRLLGTLEIKYTYKGSKVLTGGHGVEVHIHLLIALEHLKMFYRDIFQYYPKRRKMFLERLLRTKTVQYLLAQREELSYYPLSVVNNNLNIIETRKILQELTKEL